MDPKRNHKCPSKREAEGDLTAEEKVVRRSRERFEDSGLKDGVKGHEPRNAAKCELEKIRDFP